MRETSPLPSGQHRAFKARAVLRSMRDTLFLAGANRTRITRFRAGCVALTPPRTLQLPSVVAARRHLSSEHEAGTHRCDRLQQRGPRENRTPCVVRRLVYSQLHPMVQSTHVRAGWRPPSCSMDAYAPCLRFGDTDMVCSPALTRHDKRGPLEPAFSWNFLTHGHEDSNPE